MEDFPVSPVFENLQDMGSIFPGRFYMPCTTTTEPMSLEPMFCKKRHCNEDPTQCNYRKLAHSSEDPAPAKIKCKKTECKYTFFPLKIFVPEKLLKNDWYILKFLVFLN